MVYMNANNDLDRYSVANFKQIAAVGSTPDVNVVVLYGRAAWANTYRVRVTRGEVADPLPPSGAGVDDWGPLDMGDPATLQRFVVQTQQKYPADRYALVVWDHGDGFHLFEEVIGGGSGRDPLSNPRFENARSFWAVTYGGDGRRHINISELEAVAQNATLTMVGFDACLMSMIEVVYALRRSVKSAVGSEDMVPLAGWPYSQVLTAWGAGAGGTPVSIANGIVDDYMASADPRNAADMTMSAVDMDAVNASGLFGAVQSLAKALAHTIRSQDGLNAVENARGNCCEFDPKDTDRDGFPSFQHVDLGELCNQLLGWSKDSAVLSAARSLRSILRQPVYSKAGSNRLKVGYRSTGLAIYFPADRHLYQRDQSSGLGNLYEPTADPTLPTNATLSFVRDRIGWAEFLQAYLAAAPLLSQRSVCE